MKFKFIFMSFVAITEREKESQQLQLLRFYEHFVNNELRARFIVILTESDDIWMARIGWANWMVFSSEKVSSDHRHTDASRLDDTSTSLAWLTTTDVTAPRWYSILFICKCRWKIIVVRELKINISHGHCRRVWSLRKKKRAEYCDKYSIMMAIP